MRRRQSVSVQPTARTALPTGILGKKRSHSITPGEKLQDRPLLRPRKSILKQAPPQSDTNESTGADFTSVGVGFSSQASNDATMSMDLTRDFTTQVHDNATRKSLGRRVSFASHAHVRVFENEQNTNSSGAPSSSPPPESDLANSPEAARLDGLPPHFSDENDYPGRQTGLPRRSSLPLSDNGEQSMSMDLDDDGANEPLQSIFFPGQHPQSLLSESALADSDSDMDQTMDEADDDDMEITEAIALNVERRQSLSVARQYADASRRRSSMAAKRRSSIKPSTGSHPQEPSSDGFGEEPMEFTIPLNKALKKPRPPSEAWLALQAMTGSGSADSQVEEPGHISNDDGYAGSDMDLTDALSRLQKARESLGYGTASSQGDDSFTSSDDDDGEADMEIGDRTMNVTTLMESVRVSDAHDNRFIASVPLPLEISLSAPQPKIPPLAPVRPLSIPASKVFSAPPVASQTTAFQKPQSVISPSPAPHTSNNVTQSPARPRPVFSNAITNTANLNERPNRPSPFKPSAKQSLSPKKPTESPKKRPPPASPDREWSMTPSPAKKRAIASSSHLPVASRNGLQSRLSLVGASAKAGPASPSKKPAVTSTFRRPSGYFAQRKSLAPAKSGSLAAVPPKASDTTNAGLRQPILKLKPLSPNKKVIVEATPGQKNMDVDIVEEDEQPDETCDVDETPQIVISPAESEHEEPERLSRIDEADTIDNTAQWRSSLLADPPLEEEEEGPPISIEQFFSMTGIKFMDELTIPRRSTIRPFVLQHDEGNEGSSKLADVVTAMNIDVPQLELYSWVASDLQQWIERSKDNFKQAEEEAELMTPGLFREFSQANEEGREELLHTLKLIKANNHNTAKSQWYDWKYQWIENLYETVDKGHNDLLSDKSTLGDVAAQADKLIPTLRQQHEQILQELEQEQAEIAQIENDDPSYLEELKATIAEQNIMLDHFRSEMEEGTAKLDRLNEKLADLELEKDENTTAIDDAERVIHLQQNSTRAEVFRLRDELETLQALHLWRATKIQSDLLEFVYDSQYRITIPCIKYRPIANKTKIVAWSGRKQKGREIFPAFAEYVLHRAQQHVITADSMTTKQIITRLSNLWASCAQIRSQLTYLAIKFPLVVQPIPSKPSFSAGLKASASILLHNSKSKTVVDFIFDDEMVASWPMSISALRCEVRVAYGSIDPNVIRRAVIQRLDQATPDLSYACLLDACVEATARDE